MRTGLVLSALTVAGCGRSQLEPFRPLVVDAAATADRPADLASDRVDTPPDMGPDLPPDVRPDLPPDAPRDTPPDKSMAPACQPQPETCNDKDDDCDGIKDEDLPAMPCPGGGSRFCVSGRYSDCPRRCDVCVPGSKRTCITSYCTFWGSQTCADDGRSFGRCDESRPPRECEEVANRMMRSRELEKCCIDAGYCCVDEFDLNENGNTTEMLGRCDAVVCDP